MIIHILVLYMSRQNKFSRFFFFSYFIFYFCPITNTTYFFVLINDITFTSHEAKIFHRQNETILLKFIQTHYIVYTHAYI